MTAEQLKEIISQMTLEEKAAMCSGDDFWHTKAVERLGVPRSMVSDGPHGLRKQDQSGDHLGINDSIKAVCFPTACGTAASFNRDLLYSMGQTLGQECQAEDVSVILGPAVNIKRSPLCGRNFEYYSEDPYLATEIATSQINGVQSRHVGTSIKHFMANNQETRRMSSDSRIDERTMREIYLAAFEGAVKHAKPWTVMCSYNRINGTYAAENKQLLTDILRDEWGFDGYVVSDWGAVNDRVEGVKAGLDLEMPASHGVNDALIVKAVREGRLDEAVLDKAVERILNIVYRFVENRDETAVFDRDKDHEMARKVAEESIVLLKNDGILPLSETDEIAFIGKFAKKPRFQGGGSSHINSHKVDSAMDMVAGMANITYAQGYDDAEVFPFQWIVPHLPEAALQPDAYIPVSARQKQNSCLLQTRAALPAEPHRYSSAAYTFFPCQKLQPLPIAPHRFPPETAIQAKMGANTGSLFPITDKIKPHLKKSAETHSCPTHVYGLSVTDHKKYQAAGTDNSPDGTGSQNPYDPRTDTDTVRLSADNFPDRPDIR